MHELLKRPHPAIVHFPLSLYPVSFIFLALFWFQQNSLWLSMSFWCYILGAISVLPVAITGMLDMVRLKAHSASAHRWLNLHAWHGGIITLFSIISGVYFYIYQPMAEPALLRAFAFLVSLMSLMVLVQGYMGAVMVYQKHLGIDGDTR